MSCKKGKIWGSTESLFNCNNVELHRIEGKSGGYCSTHQHQHKFNMFYVEKGVLLVTIYRKDAGQEIEDVTVLKENQSTIVEPGLFHKFEVIEDCVAFEIYWTELNTEDIIRKNVGGINK